MGIAPDGASPAALSQSLILISARRRGVGNVARRAPAGGGGLGQQQAKAGLPGAALDRHDLADLDAVEQDRLTAERGRLKRHHALVHFRRHRLFPV